MKFPILTFIFVVILSRSCLCNICELCKCTNDGENGVIIQCISTVKNNITLELDNIQWPSGNVSLQAYFNYLKFTYLPKILGSLAIKSLNLDSNIIDSMTMDPFQHCKSMESLSLANNSISTLSKDFLKSIEYLQELNLARNTLSTIDNNILTHLPNLRKIDLSYNKLTTVSAEIMALHTVETLNLEGNLIFVVQKSDESKTSLTDLNLSKNKFTMISSTTFQRFSHLDNLNLSFNKIANIEVEAFINLTSLKTLDLSNNKLEEVSLSLPDSLEHLLLSFNNLLKWSMNRIPINLIHLELQYNNLVELLNPKWPLNNLEVLNASHNLIEQLPGQHFPSLNVLDLSNNQFSHIPKNLGGQIPNLNTLTMDHNPIERIYFDETIPIRRLSFRHMPILQEINANDFSNINSSKSCIDLTISHCPHLSVINEGSFDSIDFCKLDLSYNTLATLPENLANWTDINGGIDFQGNPLICNCTIQWMLDVVLKMLYSNVKHQHYLTNLRCAGPKPFTGHRLVKYYRKRAAFCNPNSNMVVSQYLNEDVEKINNGGLEIFTGQASSVIIIIAICAVSLILLILIGIHLTQLQKRRLAKKNRRYPLY